MREWAPGSLYDNIDVFASSLGFQNASVAIMLAMVPWESVEDRDSFIVSLTEESPRGGKPKLAGGLDVAI
jgi:hypothetical protein